MIFNPTPISGAFVIEPDPIGDERGSFARLWCLDELSDHGIDVAFVQANVSRSVERGTLRGLHWQHPPHAESKLVRCTGGAVYDAFVDLRPDSETYMEAFGVELSVDNRRMAFVPEGCAHGYLTMTDDAEVSYFVSAAYAPGAEHGIRYDDPAVDLDWPVPVTVVSDKDRAWPDWTDARHPMMHASS